MKQLKPASKRLAWNDNNFILNYNCLEACGSIIKEIFIDNIYKFNSKKSNPVIIDAGSNIGIATIYFKSIFPNAEILCFEPEPYAYKCLLQNIQDNNFNNVYPINAALFNVDGIMNFFGEVIGTNCDPRGNSLVELWGKQRKSAGSINVKTVKLSRYINKRIDLLKLDIEGVERQVLEEISNKLKFVRNIIIEVHDINKSNNLKEIIKLLQDNNFAINEKTIVNLDHLPAATMDWAKRYKPNISIVNASNNLNL